MHTRRLISFLVGFWLGGSLFMIAVATQNFAGVDRLLASPAAAAANNIKLLGPDAARAFLRYQASEMNRFLFDNWETAQLLLGTVLIALLLFTRAPDKIGAGLALGMLILVAILHWLLTPQLVSIGRAIDFLPAHLSSPLPARFWRFHNAYSALELAKIGLGIVLLAKLLFVGSRQRTKVRREVDPIHDADHSHVDR